MCLAACWSQGCASHVRTKQAARRSDCVPSFCCVPAFSTPQQARLSLDATILTEIHQINTLEVCVSASACLIHLQPTQALTLHRNLLPQTTRRRVCDVDVLFKEAGCDAVSGSEHQSYILCDVVSMLCRSWLSNSMWSRHHSSQLQLSPLHALSQQQRRP